MKKLVAGICTFCGCAVDAIKPEAQPLPPIPVSDTGGESAVVPIIEKPAVNVMELANSFYHTYQTELLVGVFIVFIAIVMYMYWKRD